MYFICFYIPLSRANTSERSTGSPVWYLGLFSGRPFVLERQVCSLSTKSQVLTTLHYTITVCCNRTAHSQHCLPASVETRELNLKFGRAPGELKPGPFAPAAECVTTRPPRPPRLSCCIYCLVICLVHLCVLLYVLLYISGSCYMS